MLTVKNIGPAGHENIWPAIRVSYQPPAPTSFDSATIFIDRMGERGMVDTIDIGAPGIWYVMNEQGKTIAKYELPDPAVRPKPAHSTSHLTFNTGSSRIND